jgi:NAD(P)-dependent dehydrogenase (short-subunit alcohol dehydrogenase family)
MARSALVTGGSSGIGLAIARVLREEGFDLTLSARGVERLEQAAAELGAHAYPADVASEEACVELVAAHVARFGGLDVLVNCAGVGVGRPLERAEARHLRLQFSVNLDAAVFATREAIPHLRRTRGLIVNVASVAGKVPSPGLALYGASKAALISLTQSLNAELGGDGVRACALCPGYVDTPLAEWTELPSAQMIQPEDCAEVVRLLLRLSPAARIPEVVIERVTRGGTTRDAF